jgi:hypothetical protein
VRARGLLIGFALVIVGTLASAVFGGLGKLMVIAGALYAWWHMAQVMMGKPWPPLKLKAMQALAGIFAVAVALTPLRLPPRGIMVIALLGAAIGWFAPWLILRMKRK